MKKTEMTLLNIWDGECKQRDTRTGEWRIKRIVVGRNSLHVVSDDFAVSDETSRRKGSFNSSVSYNLNHFKIEVGKTEVDGNQFFCLFLVSGHTKVAFGFESRKNLQVFFIVEKNILCSKQRYTVIDHSKQFNCERFFIPSHSVASFRPQ